MISRIFCCVIQVEREATREEEQIKDIYLMFIERDLSFSSFVFTTEDTSSDDED